MDYLEEDVLFKISEELIEEYFNRMPLSTDETNEVACILEEIEMI